MKRIVMELWVSDAAASEMSDEAKAEFGEIVDGEKVLGARITLPDGNILREGQTFG